MRIVILLFVLALSWLPAISSEAATITAASCNNTQAQPHVRNAVYAAQNGDTVIIPAGTCTWTLWLDSIGVSFGCIQTGGGYDCSLGNKWIKIQGGGAAGNRYNWRINKETRAQALANVCTPAQTTYTCILDNMDRAVGVANSTRHLIRWDMIQPSGGFVVEISNINFISLCPSDGTNSGMLRFRGNNSSFRFHHNAVIPCGTSGFFIDGNIQGVADHNYFNCDDSFCMYVLHPQWNPGGNGDGTAYGDQSYNTPQSLGTANAWFVESNLIRRTPPFNTANPYCCDGWRGQRVVYRDNDMENVNIDSHGTESGGRDRGTFQFEVYNNRWVAAFSPGASFPSLFGVRGGMGVVFGNTYTVTNGNLNAYFDMRDYRFELHNSPVFGFCTGSNAWDQNLGTPGQPGYRCLDQVGNGHGDYIQGTDANPTNRTLGGIIAFPRQSTVGVYVYSNTCASGCGSGVISQTAVIQLNRDYFLSAPGPGKPLTSYAAYTFPHPFIGGAGPDTTPPAAPTGVTIQ